MLSGLASVYACPTYRYDMILALMLEFNYEPLGQMVFVRKQRRESNLYLGMGTEKGVPTGHYEVLAVGPGRVTVTGALIEPRVKVGDIIIGVHGAFLHRPPGIEEEGTGFLTEDHIACVVTPKEGN